VLEQMLLAVERRRHAVVAVEHLARQIQAAEGRQIRGRSSKGERGRGGRYVRRRRRRRMRGPRGRGGSRA
jgi:hypothetical protein